MEGIISSSEKIETEHLKKKIPDVTVELDKCKKELFSYLVQVQETLAHPKRRDNDSIFTKGLIVRDKLSHSIRNNTEEAIEQDVLICNQLLDQRVLELKKIDFALQITALICEIHEDIISINKLLRKKNFVECIDLILLVKHKISNIPCKEKLEVVNKLVEVVDTKKTILIDEMQNIFQENIVLVENVSNNTMIKIKETDGVIKQALLALYKNNVDIHRINMFTKFVWNKIFVPIVDYETEVNTTKEGDFSILQVIIRNISKKNNYKDVFKNLIRVVEFLNTNFNIPLCEEFTTLGYVGRDVRDNLSELIIKHCLQDTIPNTVEGLKKYNVVIEDTKNLEDALRKSNIFMEDTTSILEYASNIDILFINKKCQDYVEEAKNIMKKDLHDLTEVGVPYDPNNPLGESGFLQCSVSKSTLELIQFAEKIMQQAITSSEISAGRLFCSVQNIFHLYGKFVPDHHKKLLQTIPQQVALFHNNCIYMSYQLAEWNETYCCQLSPVVKAASSDFKSEISHLSNIGTSLFDTYVNGQIKIIQEIMKNADLDVPSLENIGPSTEKCLRQCIRQQELLRTVWQKVLSYVVYNKTLGNIFNALCEMVITAVLKFEDISSDGGEQLLESLKILQTRGPKLFSDSNEITLFVSSWYKFNELVFVLKSSLVDICDRWADGKGPLAIAFTPEELRQIIKALFQNTDRRAAVLSKIQD